METLKKAGNELMHNREGLCISSWQGTGSFFSTDSRSLH